MGAQSFSVSSRGKSMSQAYDRACKDAEEEYGHQQGYSGTITTTDGFSDVTAEFKRSKKDLNKFINDNIDKADKWGNCLAICIDEPKSNKNKIKTQVEHIVSKGTKKWELSFVVTSRDGTIGSKKTKGDAVKLAREYSEKHQTRTSIHMEKVLVGGGSKVAEISYKASTNEKEGKYVFFGWAAC